MIEDIANSILDSMDDEGKRVGNGTYASPLTPNLSQMRRWVKKAIEDSKINIPQ